VGDGRVGVEMDRRHEGDEWDRADARINNWKKVFIER
jgi:hypothetical protein